MLVKSSKVVGTLVIKVYRRKILLIYHIIAEGKISAKEKMFSDTVIRLLMD